MQQKLATARKILGMIDHDRYVFAAGLQLANLIPNEEIVLGADVRGRRAATHGRLPILKKKTLGWYRLGHDRGGDHVFVGRFLFDCLRHMQRMLMMIVAHDLEEKRLRAQIVNEGLGHLDAKVLYVKEAEGRTFARVLDGLRGEGLVGAMQKVELTKNVRKVRRDAGYLDDDYAKLELTPDRLQMRLQNARVDFGQTLLD
jgi:hypothetical protein